MYIYPKHPEKPMIFEMPSCHCRPVSIETPTELISIYDFLDKYEGILVITISDIELVHYSKIISSIDLDIKDYYNSDKLDIYRFPDRFLERDNQPSS